VLSLLPHIGGAIPGDPGEGGEGATGIGGDGGVGRGGTEHPPDIYDVKMAQTCPEGGVAPDPPIWLVVVLVQLLLFMPTVISSPLPVSVLHIDSVTQISPAKQR